MTAILRNESRKLLRGSGLLTGLIVVLSFFFLAVFPGIKEEAEAIRDLYPEYIVAILGFEELHTFEGFAAGYVYPLVMVVLAGIYVAYVAAGMINADIRDRKMDLTLSNPVSRESVVLQKVGALWVPLLVLNVGLFVVLVVGALLLGEPIDPLSFVMVHLFSVPYLLVCGGIGIVLSVVLDREGSAQAAALGLVFVLWLVDGIAEMSPDFELLGRVTPSRYYDPVAILVHEEYALLDAGVLLVAFLVLLGVAVVVFVRRDI